MHWAKHGAGNEWCLVARYRFVSGAAETHVELT